MLVVLLTGLVVLVLLHCINQDFCFGDPLHWFCKGIALVLSLGGVGWSHCGDGVNVCDMGLVQV